MSRYRRILVGIDFSSRTPVALETATRVADLLHAGELHLFHATRPWSWPGPLAVDDGGYSVMWDRLIELACEELASIAVPPTSATVTRDVRCGPPAFELIEHAKLIDADLIIVATQALGPLQRAFLGSVAHALVRGAHCPILIIGEDRRLIAPPKRIVAAIDLSPISEAVVEHADAIAKLTGGQLTVASALDFAAGRETIEPRPAFERLPLMHRRAVAELAERATGPDRPARLAIAVEASPSRFILETLAAEHADLVVLGTSGHNAWQRILLGSTATRIVGQAPCPVLVIPYDPKVWRADHGPH